MKKQIEKWNNPELIQYDVNELLQKISLRASSGDNLCTYDVLKEGNGSAGGGFPGLGGNETICLEVGPLGGCTEFLFCQYEVILK